MYLMGGPPGAKTIINHTEMDYFCGTGYFALQSHSDLIKTVCEATQKYGITSATSRAGYGNNPFLLDVEERASAFFGAESALYFVSAYFGNAILLQGLAPDYDIIFADEQSHYAIRDGANMANKPIVFFAHCDANDLKNKLKTKLKPSQKPLLCCDGVFPTTGRISPLHDYDLILDQFDHALMCVDDAHAVGVIGEKGRGTLEYWGINKPNRYFCGSMSKAFGGHGGIIAGTGPFVESLRKTSTIYSGSSASPIAAAAASAKALEILSDKPEMRQQLWENIAYAKQAFRSIGFDNISDTPVPIICLTAQSVDLHSVQKQLFSKGIAVLFVPGGTYTSVPETGALRVSIFSTHNKNQIDRLVYEIQLLL